ncbi:serine/arginine-rich splicing factor SC35-like [Magnolia sinica]|uniref:serine/arginine-rich splicing factor SC35-like n=1 Tax=Magnolia sinica TaxID=86752 RepID=UPI002657F5CC|nr:serine/arginine-rich splicing factor SC35-like [Magnolia sinica]
MTNSWVRVLARKSISSKSFFSNFAANLTFDTTAEDLLRIFSRFGKIQDVFLPWNCQLHKSRGFAFIRFYYEQDAHNAIQCLHERRIDGKVVLVEWAKGKSGGARLEMSPTLQPVTLQKGPGMA